jgi:hypothetical protein
MFQPYRATGRMSNANRVFRSNAGEVTAFGPLQAAYPPNSDVSEYKTRTQTRRQSGSSEDHPRPHIRYR